VVVVSVTAVHEVSARSYRDRRSTDPCLCRHLPSFNQRLAGLSNASLQTLVLPSHICGAACVGQGLVCAEPPGPRSRLRAGLLCRKPSIPLLAITCAASPSLRCLHSPSAVQTPASVEPSCGRVRQLRRIASPGCEPARLPPRRHPRRPQCRRSCRRGRGGLAFHCWPPAARAHPGDNGPSGVIREGDGEKAGWARPWRNRPKREREKEGWRGFTKGRASDSRGSAPQAMEEFKSYMTDQPPVFEKSAQSEHCLGMRSLPTSQD